MHFNTKLVQHISELVTTEEDSDNKISQLMVFSELLKLSNFMFFLYILIETDTVLQNLIISVQCTSNTEKCQN